MPMEDQRRSPRVRCRLQCTLQWSGGHGAGTVRNVSAGGLAVQTEVDASEGETVRVRVSPLTGAPVEVGALVWHAHCVRARRTGRHGFLLGLVVSSPPEAWFERVGAPRAVPQRPKGVPELREPAAPQCCDADGQHGSFVVRLKQPGSPRTRTFRVQAASLGEARAQADADAGEDWQVIEVRAA